MVKKVDSQALGIVNRALGLTGAGSPETEFLDGVIDQVLDVTALIRRGRALADTSGMFFPTLRVANASATTADANIDPYNVGVGNAVAPYPPAVPTSQDVWLLGASVRQVSGTGTLSATLSLTVGTRNQGFGDDNFGGLNLVSEPIRLAFWDAIGTDATNFGILNQLGTHQRIGIRVPRNISTLVFSLTTSAAATFDCQLIVGLFPVALGQDGIV